MSSVKRPSLLPTQRKICPFSPRVTPKRIIFSLGSVMACLLLAATVFADGGFFMMGDVRVHCCALFVGHSGN